MALRSVIVLWCIFALVANATILSLRDPEAKHSEGSSSEWISQLNKLRRILPDDAFWEDSIHGTIELHKGEVIDICSFVQFACNSHHEIEAVTFIDVRGRVDWEQMPATVQFVTISDSKFKTGLSFVGLPDTIQSLRYFNVKFELEKASGSAKGTPTHLREFVCENCGLTSLDWSSLPKLMSINIAHNNFEYIPAEHLGKGLRLANFSHCATRADLWGHLPASLVTLDLSGTHQTKIGDLPPSLEVLYLSNNLIMGDLDVSKMPETLTHLDVSNNQLSGTVPSLSGLKKLTHVNFANNAFTSISWADLPPSISVLIGSANRISGTVDFRSLPETLTVFDFGFNQLSGSADFTSLPPNIDTINIESNKFSGPVDFTKFPSSTRFVFAQKNEFTGRPDVSKLPLDLRRILFGGNKWTSLMPPP